MSSRPPAPSAAEVDHMIGRVTELLKATRPQVNAKRPDWRRIEQLLSMARDEVADAIGSILDWELEKLAARRRKDAAE